MDRNDEIERLWAVYRSNPQNESLFNNLKQVCFFSRDWKTLVSVLLMRANSIPPGVDASKILFEAAEIYEKRLQNPETAVSMYEKSLKADPSNRDSIARLGDLCFETGAHEKALQYLKLRMRTESDSGALVAVLSKAANAQISLGHPADAEATLRQLIQTDPRNSPALKTLADLLQKREGWEDLVSVNELILEVTEHPEEKRKILFRNAKILEDKLGRPKVAAEHFRKMIEDRPIPMIMKEIERICRKIGDWEGLAAILKREAASSTDEAEKASYLYELGRVLDEKLGRSDESIESLRASGGGDKFSIETLDKLEDLYGRQGRYADLADVLVRKEAMTAGNKAIRLKIAGLYAERLGDPAKALHWFRKAFEADPSDASVEADLVYLLDRSGMHADLAQWYGERASMEAGRNPAEAARFLVEKGTIELDRLNNPAAAAETLKAAVKADPGSGNAEALLNRALEGSGNLEDLARLAREKAEAIPDPALRLPHLLRLGGILASMPGREDDASDAYWKALDVDSSCFEAIRALGTILARAGKYRDLVRLYMRTVELVGDLSEVASLHVKAGVIYRDRLDSPSMALASFRKAFMADRRNRDAMAGLKPLLASESRFEEYLDVLEAGKDVAASPAEEVGVLVEIARLCIGGLNRPDRAQAALEEALRLDSGHRPALDLLEQIHRDSGNDRKLTEVLKRRAGLAKDRFDAAAANVELGRTAWSRLGDAAEAVNAYERALAFDPGNAAALAEVEGLYEKLGRWAEQVAAIETRADAAPDPAERRRLLLKAAEIAEARLTGPGTALGLLDRADECDRSDLTAIVRKEGILRAAGDFRRLADTLSAHQSRLAGPSAEIEREIARIRQARLSDAPGALESWRRLLAVSPGDAEALDAAAALTKETGDWTGHVAVLEAKLGPSAAGAERASILSSMGIALQERLKRPGDAFACYMKAFAEDPASPAIRARIESLAPELGEWKALASVGEREVADAPAGEKAALLGKLSALMEEKCLDLAGAIHAAVRMLEASPGDGRALGRLAGLYRKAGDAERLRPVLVQLAEKAAQGPEAAGFYSDLCGLELSLPDGLSAAVGWAEKAAAADPSDPGRLVSLSRLYGQASRTAERTAALRRAAGLHPDAGQRAAVFMELCEAETAAGNLRDGARAACEEAFRIDPSNLAALRRLRDIAAAIGDDDAVARLIGKELEISGKSGPHARDLMLSLGALHEGKGSDAAAESVFREILAADPACVPALHAIEGICMRRGDAAGLAAAYDGLANAVPAPEDRRNFLVRSAQIRMERLSDPRSAAQAFARAADLDPACAAAVAGLLKAAEAAGDSGLYSRAVDLAFALPGRDEMKYSLLRTAGLKLAREGRQAEALSCLDRAASLSAADSGMLDVLAGLLEGAGRWDRLAWTLKALLSIAADSPGKCGISVRLARVLDGKLGLAMEAKDVLSAAGPCASDANSLFLELCERLGDRRGLKSALESEAAFAADPSGRRDAFLRLGSVCAALADEAAEAAGWFEKALMQDPSCREAAKALEGLYARLGLHERLAALKRRLALMETEPAARDVLFAEAGEICERDLADDAAALAAYSLVRGGGAAGIAAASGTARLCSASGLFHDAIAARMRELSLDASAERRTEILREVGGLWFSKLRNPSRAMDAFESLSALAPDEPRCSAWLQEIYSALGMWDRLVALLDREIGRARSDQRKASLLRQAAAVLSRRQGDAKGASNYLLRAWRMDSSDEVLLEELRSMLRKAGDMKGLLRIEEEIFSTMPETEPGRRFDQLAGIGRILMESSPDLAAAARHFEKALEIRPDSSEVARVLKDLYERLGNLTGLARLMEAEMPSLPQAQAAAAGKALGRLYEKRLGFYEDAARVLKPILDRDPADAEARNSLKRCYRGAGRFKDLISTWDVEFMRTQDKAKGSRILCIIGRIYRDDLGRIEEAVTSFLEASELAPGNAQAAAALVDLYLRKGDRKAAAAMYRKRAELSGGASERARFESLAGAAFEAAGEIPEARSAFEAVLECAPGDAAALGSLVSIYEKLGEWGKYADALGSLAGIEKDPVKSAALHLRMAGSLLDRLGRPSEARKSVEKALALNPDGLPALRAMEKILRLGGDHEGLVENLRRQSRAETDIAAKARLHSEAGRILLDRIGDRDAAAGEFRVSLSFDPASLAPLVGIAGISVDKGNWQEALESLESLSKLMDGSCDLKDRVRVHHSHGLALERLSAPPEDAVEQYMKAVRLDPGHLPSLEAAARIYFGLGQWVNAAGVLDRLIEEGRGKLSRQAEEGWRLALGRCRLESGSPEKALAALKGTEWPEGKEAEYHGVAAGIRRALSDWEGLIAVLDAAALRFKDGASLAGVHAEAGRVLLARLGRPAEAAARFEAALAANPSEAGAAAGLAGSLEASGQWAAAAAAWEKALASSPDAAGKSGALLHLGRCRLESGAGAETAVAAFKEALKEAPHSREILGAIRKAREAAGDFAALRADIDEIALAAARAPASFLNSLRFASGEVRARLHEFAEAAGEFRKVLESDPGHEAARVNLARILGRSDETLAEALAEHRYLIEHVKARFDSLKRMSAIYRKMGDSDRAFLAIAAGSAYAQLADEDRDFYLRHAPVSAPACPAAADALRPLAESSGGLPGRVFDLVDPYLGEAAGGGLDPFEISRKSMKGGDMETPAGKMAASFASLLGLSEFRFVIGRNPGSKLALVPGCPPTVVVTPEFDGSAGSIENAFLMGRALGLAWARRTTPAFLDPARLWRLLETFARMLLDSAPPPADPAEDRAWAKAVKAVLPRWARKQAEPLMKEFMERRSEIDLARFCADSREIAQRMGLVFAADPSHCLRTLAANPDCFEGIPSRAAGPKPGLQDEPARRLVLFALSDEYAEARRRLGHAVVAEREET